MNERSASEFSALVLRAARGAGVPLGAAEDLASAVRWLSDAGPVLAALESDFSVSVDLAGPKGRALVEGVAALELAVSQTGKEIRVPVKDAPAVLQALACVLAERLGVRLDLRSEDGLIIVVASDEEPDLPRPVGRRHVSEEHWSALSKFAARTYVPASKESRLAGAGAGLTDND